MTKNSRTNSRTVEEIDEAAMLQSIYERDNDISGSPIKAQTQPVAPPETQQQPEIPDTSKEVKESKETKEPVRRKKSNMDYGSQFLQRNELKTRSCVYISQKVHSTISEIVKNISAGELTVGGYIDSILIEHLETHKEAINELYRQETAKKNNIGLIDF